MAAAASSSAKRGSTPASDGPSADGKRPLRNTGGLSFDSDHAKAALALLDADFLLITAGAGFSADSGLPVYKDIADLPAYHRRKLDYAAPQLLAAGYNGRSQPVHGYRQTDDDPASSPFGPATLRLTTAVGYEVDVGDFAAVKAATTTPGARGRGDRRGRRGARGPVSRRASTLGISSRGRRRRG